MSESPSLKLYYFGGVYARGEAIRTTAKIFNIPLEEEVLDFETFVEKIKDKTPFGTLPVVEVNGKFYGECNALILYLARLAGEYPLKSHEETLELDGLICYVRHAIDKFFACFGERLLFKHLFGGAPIYGEPFSEAEEKVFKQDLHPCFETLDRMASKYDGKSLLGGDKIGIAELCALHVVDVVNTPFAKSMEMDVKYPNLLALYERIKSLPQMKEHLENRPAATF